VTWNHAEHHAEPSGTTSGGRLIEVACDESGSDGENLTSGNTDVFAHASVQLPIESAAEYVQEIRNRIRSPAEEYKANHLLREKHRAVLEWLLGESGPIHGHAHVHLTDKAFFVVDRVLDLLLDDTAPALLLFREGRRTFASGQWEDFLRASNHLLRVRINADTGTPVDSFFRRVDDLRQASRRADVDEILALLGQTRSRADSYRARMLDTPAVIPVLNPLLPAIVRTAAYWGAGGRPVRLVHDRQNMLTPERIAWIQETARLTGHGLTGVRLVHSRLDARVQLADFLAGIARKIASDELNERGDPRLTALLRPYVDTASVWGDERSGNLLTLRAGNSRI